MSSFEAFVAAADGQLKFKTVLGRCCIHMCMGSTVHILMTGVGVSYR